MVARGWLAYSLDLIGPATVTGDEVELGIKL